MRELQELEVKVLSEAAGLNVPQEDLRSLTVRLNGLLEMASILESLPLDRVEPIPTLPAQRDS